MLVLQAGCWFGFPTSLVERLVLLLEVHWPAVQPRLAHREYGRWCRIENAALSAWAMLPLVDWSVKLRKGGAWHLLLTPLVRTGCGLDCGAPFQTLMGCFSHTRRRPAAMHGTQ